MSKLGKGTKLEVSTDGGTTKILVSKAFEITLPEISHKELDDTHHDDPDDFERKIAGPGSVGDIPLKVTMNEDSPGHLALQDLALSGDTATFIVTPPAPYKKWTCEGFVKSYKQPTPIDGKITAEFNIAVSGKPELSAQV